MKTLLGSILIAVAILSSTSFARTQSIFRANGTQGTVMVSGMPGDLDALNLYQSLTAPEQIIDSKRTKRMNFENAAGQRMFSVVCVLSAIVNENGTCTVIIKAGPGATIDRGQGLAQFASTDPAELSVLEALFVRPASGETIFVSGDGKLRVSTSLSDGRARAFELIYH